MTTPAERATALMQARDLLLALSNLKEFDAASLRVKAASVLRHYPDIGTIELIAERTEWLEMKRKEAESLAPVVKKVTLPPLPPSAPEESIRDVSFFENFRQRELENLRARIQSGELLATDEFRRRLRASSGALRHLIVEGSVFGIDVDGLYYFPSLLVDERYDRPRLFSVCRLIWPASPIARLHYLTSARGNLGGLTPLECLEDNAKYQLLRRMAWAEAIDSYRTTIRAYAGIHNAEPRDASPSYSVAEVLDPRRNFWDRGLATLGRHGFTGVFPPYEKLSEATVFVAQLRAGSSELQEGARLTISIDANYANVDVERFVCKRHLHIRVPLEGDETIEDAMRNVFRELWNRGAR